MLYKDAVELRGVQINEKIRTKTPYSLFQHQITNVYIKFVYHFKLETYNGEDYYSKT